MTYLRLNDGTAVSEALEMTKLAIEHGYIRKGHDSKHAAKNAYEYYSELCSLFTDSDKKKDE